MHDKQFVSEFSVPLFISLRSSSVQRLAEKPQAPSFHVYIMLFVCVGVCVCVIYRKLQQLLIVQLI